MGWGVENFDISQWRWVWNLKNFKISGVEGGLRLDRFLGSLSMKITCENLRVSPIRASRLILSVSSLSFGFCYRRVEPLLQPLLTKRTKGLILEFIFSRLTATASAYPYISLKPASDHITYHAGPSSIWKCSYRVFFRSHTSIHTMLLGLTGSPLEDCGTGHKRSNDVLQFFHYQSPLALKKFVQ
jgi:hypothetical protein